MPRIFRLDINQFKDFKKNLILRTFPIILLPIAVVIYFTKSTPNTLMIMIPLFTGIIIFNIWTQLKRQKKAWETFELTISENQIKKNQSGYPEISIEKDDIVEVLEAKNGAYTIKTKSRSNFIVIPNAIEDREELKTLLTSFSDFRSDKKNLGIFFTYGSAIIGVGLFLSFLISQNSLFTIVSGLPLLALFIYAFKEIQQNKNFDKRFRKLSWIFIFPFLTVLAKFIYAILSLF